MLAQYFRHPFFYEENQYFELPANCENGWTVGDITVTWTHFKFFNIFFGMSFSWANYIYTITGGNADNAFSINLISGRLTITNASLFTATRSITVRATLPSGHYGESICVIHRIPIEKCVFFDSSITNSSGDGSKESPYGGFKYQMFGSSAGIKYGTPGMHYY